MAGKNELKFEKYSDAGHRFLITREFIPQGGIIHVVLVTVMLTERTEDKLTYRGVVSGGEMDGKTVQFSYETLKLLPALRVQSQLFEEST